MIRAILQFMQAKGSGEAALRRFLTFAAVYGEEAAIAACASAKMLEREIGVKADVAQNIIAAQSKAAMLSDSLAERSIKALWLGSPEYPERLEKILLNDAPPVLFAQGNLTLLNTSSVAFSGSRKASEKGLEVTRLCAMQMARTGICVTSGYAHGVDMAAHQAALKNGGTTIMVLVEGILRFQAKPQIADLLSPDNHLAISQFSPNLTWSGHNAMRRNDTIIGMTDSMILVEAGFSGGTFAAGENTLRRKRPLFVVDFAEPELSAEANSWFIQNGGTAIRKNQDGIPNLNRLKAAILEQSWKQPTPETTSLFNWNHQKLNIR